MTYVMIEDSPKQKNHSFKTMETLEEHEVETISFSQMLWKVYYRYIKRKGKVPLNETYAICRATLLALSIFYWCYYSLQYGPRELTILENEQILPGFVFSKKAIITFAYGYSTWHSTMSAFTVIMLLYSIISKQPEYSLPLISYFLALMVYDFCSIFLMIWLVFKNIQLETALLYTVMLLLMILAEMWMWLGVVQLYEYRSFDAK